VRRKLGYLDTAPTLVDLRSPPGNRIEPLVGDRAGQHSIRVNDQWRVCFVWKNGNAENVEIVDTTDGMCPMITRAEARAINFDDIAPGPALSPLRPGEVLLEEFMRSLGLTSRALAIELGIPGNRISSIVNGSRAITAETALLLARRFGTSAELWMNLQTAHDLAVAREAMAEDAAA
jgi:addiction module HigA family antidote